MVVVVVVVVSFLFLPYQLEATEGMDYVQMGLDAMYAEEIQAYLVKTSIQAEEDHRMFVQNHKQLWMDEKCLKIVRT